MAVFEVERHAASATGSIAIHGTSANGSRGAVLFRPAVPGDALRRSAGDVIAQADAIQTDRELLDDVLTSTKPLDPNEFVD